jgi:tripartite-type tricarboxylate transporter receptor subunit TctC
MAYFCKLAAIDMVHIPYKSTQDATNDVLAGRSHALIVPNVGATPYMSESRIRLLGVTSPARSAFLPGVPPIAEQLPGYVLESWFGILAPRGTPRAVIDRINAAVGQVLQQPVVLQRLHSQGVEPKPMAPEPFGALVMRDYETLAQVVRSLGKVD